MPLSLSNSVSNLPVSAHESSSLISVLGHQALHGEPCCRSPQGPLLKDIRAGPGFTLMTSGAAVTLSAHISISVHRFDYFCGRDSQKQNCCVKRHEKLKFGSVWHAGAVSSHCWEQACPSCWGLGSPTGAGQDLGPERLRCSEMTLRLRYLQGNRPASSCRAGPRTTPAQSTPWSISSSTIHSSNPLDPPIHMCTYLFGHTFE